MNRCMIVWTLLLALGGAYLLARAVTGHMGLAYIRQRSFDAQAEFRGQIAEIDVQEQATQAAGMTLDKEKAERRNWLKTRLPAVQGIRWTSYDRVTPREQLNRNGQRDPDVRFSWSNTIGIWLAALGTLCILSFLYGDNVFYKLAEAVIVGTSAAYAMVVGFWSTVMQNLFGKFVPSLVRATVLPSIPESTQSEWIYIVPLILSVLMLWRLSPVGGWISRWPLAFFIGATAGFRLVHYLHADFVQQISSTIVPLVVFKTDGSVEIGTTLKNSGMVASVLACLVYFFFSIEHRGSIGRIARVGIYILMITFGAAFAATVMGRISLITDRLTFLFDDWLWWIDPIGKRVGL